nr:PTS lactose/cellobiose transporter subunit IIA [Clostridium paraputrificum]
MDQELIALNLISNSGPARTKAFEALHKAREGKYEEAKILLKESEESSLLAHNAQTELLQAEANGDNSNYSIIMVHAQDHLMTSILAKELIEEMVTMYKELKK